VRLWLSVLAVTLANWVLKAAGPLALGDRPLPSVARSVVSLMAPVLLSGLIVVELAGEEWGGLDWPQLTGVAVAGFAWAVRAPMLAAVLLGALATAAIRAF
jgi:branched-subunit amino acid transport protein